MALVQPYVPRYREAFFERLAAELNSHNVTLQVFAGAATGRQAERGDASATTSSWLVPMSSRVVPIGPKSATLTNSYRFWSDADTVIVPHMGSSLDAWSALLRSRKGRQVGVWGHIASYIADPHWLDTRLESWQLRHCDHVFAYTGKGARYAQANGVDVGRVTTVGNTVDTSALKRESEGLTDGAKRDFRDRLDLQDALVFAFVGGLDASKRIHFLAEALDYLWQQRRDLVMLIGGLGADLTLLQKACDRGQVRLLGYVDDRQKALMAAVSIAFVSPGRIGLLAVETLSLVKPLLTTSWPYHAPEADYLTEGISKYSSRDDPKAFAALMADFDGVKVDRSSRSWGLAPTMTQMVENFEGGILAMLGMSDKTAERKSS